VLTPSAIRDDEALQAGPPGGPVFEGLVVAEILKAAAHRGLEVQLPDPGKRLMNVVFWWYDSGMKIKTSVTLSKEVVAMIDKHAEGETNRSAFIELAVRAYLQILQRRKRDQQDLRTINRLSEKLNKEAEDVLGYQRELRS
jgi:alpha-D-ribose 1-methylphosphonate 5-phosphate C-P lyase